MPKTASTYKFITSQEELFLKANAKICFFDKYYNITFIFFPLLDRAGKAGSGMPGTELLLVPFDLPDHVIHDLVGRRFKRLVCLGSDQRLLGYFYGQLHNFVLDLSRILKLEFDIHPDNAIIHLAQFLELLFDVFGQFGISREMNGRNLNIHKVFDWLMNIWINL